jgi:hypothetical protein
MSFRGERREPRNLLSLSPEVRDVLFVREMLTQLKSDFQVKPHEPRTPIPTEPRFLSRQGSFGMTSLFLRRLLASDPPHPRRTRGRIDGRWKPHRLLQSQGVTNGSPPQFSGGPLAANFSAFQCNLPGRGQVVGAGFHSPMVPG